MLLLHVPVSTKRPWIHYFNYPICDCSELNNAAARASDTPTEMEIRRQPQRRSATRARCVVDGGGGGRLDDQSLSIAISTRCQPLAVSTQSAPSRYVNYMYITNQSILVFCFDQKFTRYKKLYLTLVSDKHEH